MSVKPEKTHPLVINGLRRPVEMWLHDERDQHVSKDIAENGVWESYETQLFMERFEPGMTFVDVGANIGYYSLLAAAQIGGDGLIFAFEPDPDNYALLKKNLALNGLDCVDAVPSGLSNCDRIANIFCSATNFGDHRIYDDGSERSSKPISLINGSDYLRPKVDQIDLLKIDTQGAECQVIEGLLPLLQANSAKLCMIIEFWPFGLRRAGGSAHTLLDMLTLLELPIQIIDHINHQLVPCSETQLREWVDMVEENPKDEGFMNIMLGV